MKKSIFFWFVLIFIWGCGKEGGRKGKQLAALQLNTYSSSFPFSIPSGIIDPIKGKGNLYLNRYSDDLVFYFEFQSDQGFESKFSGTFTGIEKVPIYDPKEGFKQIQAYKAYVNEKGESENIILYADLEKNLIQARWVEQRKDGIYISHELTGSTEDQADETDFDNKRSLLFMAEFLSKIDSARQVIPQSVLDALDTLASDSIEY